MDLVVAFCKESVHLMAGGWAVKQKPEFSANRAASFVDSRKYGASRIFQ